MEKCIPDEDHIGRYFPSRKVAESGRISGVAFKLYPKDKGYISINHMEKIASERSEQYIGAALIYKRKIPSSNEKGGHILLLNVGLARAKIIDCTEDNRDLRFVCKPKHDEPSYAGIYGLAEDDDLIFDLLSTCIQDSYRFAPEADSPTK